MKIYLIQVHYAVQSFGFSDLFPGYFTLPYFLTPITLKISKLCLVLLL